MSSTVIDAELRNAVLALPAPARADLAEELLASLCPEEWRWEDADPEWRAAWESELQRRLKSIEDGTAEFLDGEEVVRQLRERYSS